MNNLELADWLQASASNHYGNLSGVQWDAGAALRNLHTENMALRCTEMALRDELEALNRAVSEAEPVAYIHRQGNFYEVAERLLSQDEKDRGWSEEPLYTHPAQQAKTKPLSDEQSRKLAEHHYVLSPWYETDLSSNIGSRQWCIYWDGWQAAHNIEELERQLEEVRKDAERYRWLVAQMMHPDADPQEEMFNRLHAINPDPANAKEVDATIDAAMQKGQS